jgi:hypothetical protein
MPTFYQNYLAMKNTADVTGDNPIAVWSHYISDVSAINPIFVAANVPLPGCKRGTESKVHSLMWCWLYIAYVKGNASKVLWLQFSQTSQTFFRGEIQHDISTYPVSQSLASNRVTLQLCRVFTLSFAVADDVGPVQKTGRIESWPWTGLNDKLNRGKCNLLLNYKQHWRPRAFQIQNSLYSMFNLPNLGA